MVSRNESASSWFSISVSTLSNISEKTNSSSSCTKYTLAAVRALRLRKADALLPNTPKIYIQSSQIINFVANIDNV